MTLPGPLVVSFTSHPPRFHTLERVASCLVGQTIRADAVVLWLAPHEAEQLPKPVEDALLDRGVSIRQCEDIRQYKKIIPALKAYPNACIVTVDDDHIYPNTLLRRFVDEYHSPKEVLCRAGRWITEAPYVEWPNVKVSGSGPQVFGLGYAGAFYPPGCLVPETLDAETFMRLAPTNDDIWLNWMVRRSGCVHRVIVDFSPPIELATAGDGLWSRFNRDGGNDQQLAAMVAEYGPLT